MRLSRIQIFLFVEREIFELENKCKLYEEKIEKFKIITRQRKDKINELEIKLNTIFDEKEKLKQENGKLMIQIQNLKKQIENIINTQCTLENQKTNEELCEEKKRILILSLFVMIKS